MARVTFAPTASNGTSAVSLVAALAGQIVYPTRVVIANTSATVDQSVILLSGTDELERYYVPAKSTLGFGPEDLYPVVRTALGSALQFKLGAAGAAIYVSGVAEQK